MRVHKLSKDTTLTEVESSSFTLFEGVVNGYTNPERCVGNITIRAKE
jgi:hypothetical protein